MKHVFKRLDVVSAGEYQITLASSDGSERSFLLRVDDGDIQVVTWQDDFFEFMNQNVSSAQLLFETVLAAHRAIAKALP